MQARRTRESKTSSKVDRRDDQVSDGRVRAETWNRMTKLGAEQKKGPAHVTVSVIVKFCWI
jgi:hypothetical protein